MYPHNVIKRKWRSIMKRTFKQTLNNLINQSPDGGVVPTRTTPPHVQVREAPPMVINKVSKIASTMRDLHEESCDLEKNVSELENGLAPACIPSTPEDEIEPPLPCDIPLADNIIAIIVCLKRVNKRLISLNKRLEL
jgi:hypothetical protein